MAVFFDCTAAEKLQGRVYRNGDFMTLPSHQEGVPPLGRTALVITFRFPPAAFLYKATTPRLHIDGVEAQVPGWGTHEVRVAPGRHHVHVWVPYAVPRKVGRAAAEIRVGAGQRTRLEYVAPTVAFLGGSLGLPGAQRSAAWRFVVVLNVVAAVAALVLLATTLMS